MLPRQQGAHYYEIYSVRDMATKRAAEDLEPGGSAPKKSKVIVSALLDIGGAAAGEDDLNIKVLQIQNRKLSERLRERNRGRELLEERVARLEQLQETASRYRGVVKVGLETLWNCLAVAMVAAGCEGDLLEEAELHEELKEVGGVGKVFGRVCSALETLLEGKRGRGHHTTLPPEDEESNSRDGDVKEVRGLALLRQISRHYSNRTADSDEVEALEEKCERMEEEIAQLRYLLENSQVRGDRLEKRLGDMEAKSHTLQPHPPITSASVCKGADREEGVVKGCGESQPEPCGSGSSSSGTDSGVGPGGMAKDEKSSAEEGDEGLQSDLAEARELAQAREDQILKMSLELVQMKKELDNNKISQQALSEGVVKESAPYRTLQCQYTMLVQEAGQLRVGLEEAKNILVAARQQHFTQLEEIRGEELKYQGEVREEMAGLEAALAAVKRDYELLRVEYERIVASNEQAGPVAKELRVMVDSLQKSVGQHKSEVNRYKARAHKAEQQVTKLQEEKEDKSVVSATKDSTDDLKESSGSTAKVGVAEVELKLELKSKEAELEGLRQAVSMEEKERADIIAAEKKMRLQYEELKKKFEDYHRDYERRKEHIRDEAVRKTRSLTEDNRQLQKELGNKRQEAQVLVEEMEYTTQAFEEMQEQNIRLLQQLKEKDDANLKLMSERIKANSRHKLLLEEKELLQGQLSAVAMERQRYAELVCSLEEREVSTEASLQSLEKEVTLYQQSGESHRKQCQETCQQVTQLQHLMAEQQRQLDSTHKTLDSRTEEWERESQQHRKSVEDVGVLKRKLEKYKNREWMTAGDEVLLEEIKTYRAKLNCPCCSNRKKDTVLTKCFHVFCSECIRQRYDSRLRKCPKCGAPFGANDFHKIYLA